MKGLEERVSQLEKQHETLYSEVRSMQAELDMLMQKTKESVQGKTEAPETKLRYLSEVNDQMFQQNLRLREYIEDCIQTETVPTHADYYRVLRED